jgi:hypothetical protein
MRQTYIRAPLWAIHGFTYGLQSRMGCEEMSRRSEKRAFETPPISVGSALAVGSLCSRLEKRTMREPEAKSGLREEAVRIPEDARC